MFQTAHDSLNAEASHMPNPPPYMNITQTRKCSNQSDSNDDEDVNFQSKNQQGMDDLRWNLSLKYLLFLLASWPFH